MAVPMHRTLVHLAQARKDSNGILEGNTIAATLRQANTTDLYSLLPSTTNVAVLGDSDDPRQPLTHQELRDLIQGLNLNRLGISPGVRVGVIVSNGPELAVLLVALLTAASVVPINSAGSLEEFTSEIINTGVEVLISDDADAQRLAALCVLANQLTLPLLVLTKDEHKAGAFKLAHAYHIMTTYDDSITTTPSGIGHLPGAPSLKVVIHNGDSRAQELKDTASFKGTASSNVDQQWSGSSSSPTKQGHKQGQGLSPKASWDETAPAPAARQYKKLVSFGRTSMLSRAHTADTSHTIPEEDEDVQSAFASAQIAQVAIPNGTLSSSSELEPKSPRKLSGSGASGSPLPGSASFAGRAASPTSPASPQRGLSKLRSMREALSTKYSSSGVGVLSGAASFGVSDGGSSGVMRGFARTGTGVKGAAAVLNGLEDHALILQTSGSTGSKKVVPYTLEAVLVGSTAIAASMELGPTDMAINMMPLFHAGGIFRNVLAPLLAGGSTCCMALFDAVQFWQVAENKGATWYYASPTMHMGILDALTVLDQPPSHKIRLIANAAGPLLPATAEALQSTFKGAAIMPGYGMTECMPISAPPADYRLERPGTSGQPLGPSVRIGNEQGAELPVGTIGEIMLKGAPLFQGYDRAPAATAEAFVDGWFKTGDLGYLDADGFLFITGRSKDVINRGGEIISPAEVESAVVQMPGIKAAAAFPILHDKLQESVGLVLVPDNQAGSSSRPLLPEVVQFVSGSLHPSKWPFMIVYMDDLPKGPTGKVVRTGLAKRLDLPEFNDKTPVPARHYEASAPPPSAPVNSKIPAQLADGVAEQLQQRGLAGGAADGAAGFRAPGNKLEKTCVELTAQVVGLKSSEVSVDDDFFLIGGSSMNASQLAALLRKKFQVSFTGLTIFNNRTPAEMASHILELKPELEAEGWLGNPQLSGQLSRKGSLFSRLSGGLGGGTGGPEDKGEKIPDPSLQPHVLFLQAVPAVFLIPLRRIAAWMLFIVLWFEIGHAFLIHIGPGGQRTLWALVLALMAMRFIRALVLPWVGIAAKWAIVGRYRAGRYKLWGGMYMRWWMVDKILVLTGRGFFDWTPGLMRSYFRLMGAKVGKGVAISGGAAMREFDLLSLEDDVVIDGRTCIRPFCADDGQTLLAPITLGRGSCVCVNGVIAPGSSLPAGSAVPPNGCSLEPLGKASEYKRFCQVDFPGPPMWLQCLVGFPLITAVKVASISPIIILLMVVLPAARTTFYPFTQWQAVILWLVDPAKIMVYLLGAVCYGGICPFIYIALVILVKRTIIGKFRPGPRGGPNNSSWQHFRHWLMQMLLPDGSLGHTLEKLGAHWEPVSWIYRALGAKVGKRVFWPGGGLQGVVQYDLLTVGDDVVFGSRSTYMIGDAEECLPITIMPGGNVADRGTLLPGSTVGVNACLGTGGVLGKGQYLEAGAVAVGSQNGSAVVITPGNKEAESAPTIKPFGKAQYMGQCSYYLPSVAVWTIMNWCVQVAESVYTRSKMIVTWKIVYLLLDFETKADQILLSQFFGAMLGVYTIMHILYTAFSVGFICIGCKWLIIGRRKAGSYSFDVHPYCAKWNVYIALMAFRGHILDTLGGTAYIVWYFRALGCNIGRAVCLYPAGSDPMMNEPELVTIGHNACINQAFVVNHINTKGNFSLECISIGAHTTLRAFARLMAGGTMEERSVMLEHTLALPGETVDTGMAWQGWPVNTVAPVKVLKLKEAQALESGCQDSQASRAPGPARAPSGKLASMPSVEAVSGPSSPRTGVSTEGVLAGVAGMHLRKSLRISNSLDTYRAAGLMNHLGHIEDDLMTRDMAKLGPIYSIGEDEVVVAEKQN